MTEKEKRKAREKTFTLIFEQPLSNRLLTDLSKERKIYTKYKTWDTIKIGSKVVGFVIEDTSDIFYAINDKTIAAASSKADDETLKKNLKTLADRIIDVFELDKKGYQIIEGDEYLFFENLFLENWFTETELIKNMKSEFGSETYLVEVKFAVKEAPESYELITIGYEGQKNFNKKQLTLAATKECLPKVKRAMRIDD